MRRALALAVLAVIAAAIFAFAQLVPNPGGATDMLSRPADRGHGRALAQLGDCAGCHGSDYTGGRDFPTPVGRVHASNITPDRDSGIGAYDFVDFVRVMRFGVAPHAKWIYPAMPFTAYARMSDEDLWDLFSFLRQDVAAAAKPTPSNGWLLSIRAPLAIWTRVWHDPRPFSPDSAHDALWNRGAYLVQGVAHCGSCHTPRNFALAELDVDGHSALFLSGTAFDGGAPTNLRGNDGDGLGRWSEDDIVQVLRNGRNAHSAVSGPMAEIVGDSTQYFTDEDLAAIARYLKSLTPADAQGRAHFLAGESSLERIMTGQEISEGGRIFMDSCAACHRLAGSGANGVFPGLAGNSSVLSRDPSSLIAVILIGAKLPSTAAAPSPLAMPGFAWRYDDREVAALATFIRSSWGNHASPVTADQVAANRKHWR